VNPFDSPRSACNRYHTSFIKIEFDRSEVTIAFSTSKRVGIWSWIIKWKSIAWKWHLTGKWRRRTAAYGGACSRRVFPRRTWVLPPINRPFWVHWCGQFHTIRPVTVQIGTGNVAKIRRLKSHISGHEILKLVEGFSYPWSHECFDTKFTMI